MTRITPQTTRRNMLANVQNQREKIDQTSRELSTGLAVFDPGDSKYSGTIAKFQELSARLKDHVSRTSSTTALLTFQNDILKDANETMVRAKEIATQAANETNSPEVRAQMAAEVMELRDKFASLANSTYQGRYIYGGLDDDDPPFDMGAPYATPPTGKASEHYVFDGEPGTAQGKVVPVTDDLTITVTTPGNQVFGNGLAALERLGRALSGYQTNPPDATNDAYVFPADYARQTQAIQDTITSFTNAREQDIMTETVSVAARMSRVDTAKSLLTLTKTSTDEALSRLQEADAFQSASDLANAQTALQAALTATGRILNISIMDYI